MNQDFTSFVLLTSYYKTIIIVVLLYFTFKFKDWTLGLIVVLDAIVVYLQITGHQTAAVLLSNPTATLLAYKLVQGGKHRLEVKKPQEDVPHVIPDAIIHNDGYTEDISTKGDQQS